MKRYVVTAAEVRAKVNEKFLATLKYYCKKNKAKLIVIPIPMSGGKGNLKQYTDETIDKSLLKYEIKKDLKLNSKLEVSKIPISPAVQNPLTTLDRIGKTSQIFGSPKLSLKVVPTSNAKLPHVIMSTGCITKPNYDKSKRSGILATLDHKYAAIVIEVLNNVYYHFRQLEANNKMEINDLGYNYNHKRRKKTKCSLVLGDWHVGDTDKEVENITLNKIIPELKPKNIFFHDMFNGHSVNHHNDGDIITKATKIKENKYSLVQELEDTYNAYMKFHKKTKCNIFDVASNHSDFLDRYIKEGRFFYDSPNFRIALDIAAVMHDYREPAVKGYLTKIKKLKSVKFLNIDEDYKIAGIQLANHGHIGNNGGRGSMRSQELACSKSVIGHSHSPAILRGVWRVGTSSKLKLDYNKGPSGWVHTHCIVYHDGTRQLINIINGKWRG